ncbi:MAG: anthranilate phosphoribosyltransferase, partial [Thermotaleaceae bacterium]
QIATYRINPRDLGLSLGTTEALKGGTAPENGKIILDLFQGAKGAKRDMLLLNAGAAIYVGKEAKNLEEGIARAKEIIDQGLALEKLKQLIAVSQEVAQ